MPSPHRTTDDHPPRHLRLEAATTLDLEAAGEGGATLPRFRMVAYTGTPMRVAGWRHPVVIDLAGLSIPSQARPIRFGHDPLSGVGHTDAVRVEDGQPYDSSSVACCNNDSAGGGVSMLISV